MDEMRCHLAILGPSAVERFQTLLDRRLATIIPHGALRQAPTVRGGTSIACYAIPHNVFAFVVYTRKDCQNCGKFLAECMGATLQTGVPLFVCSLDDTVARNAVSTARHFNVTHTPQLHVWFNEPVAEFDRSTGPATSHQFAQLLQSNINRMHRESVEFQSFFHPMSASPPDIDDDVVDEDDIEEDPVPVARPISRDGRVVAKSWTRDPSTPNPIAIRRGAQVRP